MIYLYYLFSNFRTAVTRQLVLWLLNPFSRQPS